MPDSTLPTPRGSERERPRPEVALRSAPSSASKRARELGNVLPRYHALNAEYPWLTACGYTIDGDSPKPLGAGDFTCQLRACQLVLGSDQR